MSRTCTWPWLADTRAEFPRLGEYMRTFHGARELLNAAGEQLGTSDWTVVDQQRIDAFANATDDHQWIHVDPERASTGPYSGTVAHGLLTLSLLPAFLRQIYTVEGVRFGLNYGYNKVRFPAPVPTGSKIRATATLTEVTPLDDAVQLTISTVIEMEGSDKPAAVVESVARYIT